MKKSLKFVSGVVAAAAFALVFSFNMSVNSGAEGIASINLEALTTATAEGENGIGAVCKYDELRWYCRRSYLEYSYCPSYDCE